MLFVFLKFTRQQQQDLVCPLNMLKTCMCLSCSSSSVLYSLFLDIRQCWTAGRGSHSSDQPSLSWWKCWETCFRPACNRYNGKDKVRTVWRLHMMLKLHLIKVQAVAEKNSLWSAAVELWCELKLKDDGDTPNRFTEMFWQMPEQNLYFKFKSPHTTLNPDHIVALLNTFKKFSRSFCRISHKCEYSGSNVVDQS